MIEFNCSTFNQFTCIFKNKCAMIFETQFQTLHPFLHHLKTCFRSGTEIGSISFFALTFLVGLSICRTIIIQFAYWVNFTLDVKLEQTRHLVQTSEIKILVTIIILENEYSEKKYFLCAKFVVRVNTVVFLGYTNRAHVNREMAVK